MKSQAIFKGISNQITKHSILIKHSIPTFYQYIGSELQVDYILPKAQNLVSSFGLKESVYDVRISEFRQKCWNRMFDLRSFEI